MRKIVAVALCAAMGAFAAASEANAECLDLTGCVRAPTLTWEDIEARFARPSPQDQQRHLFESVPPLPWPPQRYSPDSAGNLSARVDELEAAVARLKGQVRDLESQ